MGPGLRRRDVGGLGRGFIMQPRLVNDSYGGICEPYSGTHGPAERKL